MRSATGTADLYNDERSPESRWTRVNIGEAIPGVPTPLSWSIWRPAMEHGFWWAQEQLGVAGRREPKPAVISVACGRPAICVDVSLGQVARLPGYDADAFAEQYFGLPPAADGGPGRGRTGQARDLARVASRAPVSLALLGRRVRANADGSATWWRRSVQRAAAAADPLALLREAAVRFRRAMAIHTLQGVVCQGVYERATALAPDLAATLVSADGDLSEARLAEELWAVAHGDRAESAFLADHGYHGPEEGELAAPSWREDPAPLRAAVAAWREADPERSPAAAAARRAAARTAAEAELLGRLPAHRRAGARVTLSLARRLVAQREVGKAAFLQVLDVARFAARSLDGDAMWCTLDELVSGRPPPEVLDGRRRRRAELAAVKLPLSWVGDPEPLAPAYRPDGRDSPAPDREGGSLTGTGASPGVATGRARVVADPTSVTEPIGPDEVLVAHTTDPSWVTLFLTAGALVIEVGGALSHGAIIARELGIPCIIGATDAMTRIPDGATVTVDGTAGTVSRTRDG